MSGSYYKQRPARLPAPKLEAIVNGPYQPTEELQRRVRRLVMLGVPQNRIARDLGITPVELRRHYKDELDKGDVESMTTVATALWKNAVEKNNVIAQIFWLKSRHDWVDRKEVNHKHSLGPALSHEERLALLEAAPQEGPKSLDSLREVIESTAEYMPAEGNGGDPDDDDDYLEHNPDDAE